MASLTLLGCNKALPLHSCFYQSVLHRVTEFLTEQLGGQIRLTTSLGSQSRRGITLTPQLD